MTTKDADMRGQVFAQTAWCRRVGTLRAGLAGLVIASLMAVVLAAGPTRAEDFWSQVWPYADYIARTPGEAGRVAAFGRGVAGDIPPRVDRPLVNEVSITIVYPALQVSDYWRRSVASFEERLREAGLPYRLDTLFTVAGSAIEAQESFIAEALQKRPDYLVFTLDALRHKAIIEHSLVHEHTRLILQNITTPIMAWEGFQPFLYVGFDHGEGSRLLARQIVDRTGGRGRYAVVFGSPGYVSQMRGDTVIRWLSDHSAMTLVDSYYVGFDRDRARDATLRLLADHPDLDVIFACSTDIALGVIDALKAEGRLGTVWVNGWGGGSAELEALAAGDLDATVMRMNDDNGVAMADAIILDQSGRAAEVPTVFAGDLVLVTRDTPPETLSRLQERAFRYSQALDGRP